MAEHYKQNGIIDIMSIEKLEKKRDKLKKDLADVESKIETEKNKVDFIVIDGWAYETKEHDFNKELAEITIPEGRELWLPSECWKFYEDKNLREKLNLEDCWFFVRQVRDNTSDVARFFAGSVRVGLGAGYGSRDSYSTLGVRFKWKVKDGKSKKDK